MKQVITISPTGQLSGLQVKPGKGVDLRQFGAAKIERASEVLWDEIHQMWFVEVRKGLLSGWRITQHAMVEATRFYKELCTFPDTHDTALWADYDDAVHGEITYLNFVRQTYGAEVLQ